MNKEQIYFLMFEELEEFIDELQLQSEDLKKEQRLLDDFEKEEINAFENEIETNELVIEQVVSLMFILKSIAHARHELDFYDESEREYVNGLSEEMFGEALLKTKTSKKIS